MSCLNSTLSETILNSFAESFQPYLKAVLVCYKRIQGVIARFRLNDIKISYPEDSVICDKYFSRSS